MSAAHPVVHTRTVRLIGALSAALAVLALLTALPVFTDSAGAEETPPNIILLVLDTLRADHLGCYGSKLGLTPFIDELAAAGLRFHRTVSQSSWTKTSMASLFTARNPAAHGILVRRDRLAGQATLLAEQLKARGYHCLGIQTNPWLTEAYGFHQGFDEYHHLEPRAGDGKPKPAYTAASRVVRFTGRRLARTAQRPLFLYVHFMDPHAPYDPPAAHRPEHPTGEQDLYRGEIRYLDEQLRRLFAHLAEAGLDRRTLHVLLSDHGEEFGEHGGTGHGQTLYHEVLDVPLILHGDVLAPWIGAKHGRTVTQLVRLIDVAPTILELTGAAAGKNEMAGVSLLPLLGSWWPRDRNAFSQLGLNFDPQRLDEHFDHYSLTTGRHKLILDAGSGTEERFRTDRDPGEQADLSGKRSRAAEKLRSRLGKYVQSAHRHRPAADAVEDAGRGANIEQLRALGYITDEE